VSRKFKWESWDFDCDGDAYIIAKSERPERENVPDYIVTADGLSPSCKDGMVIKEGWCKYQVRTDWENCDGEPRGGYLVDQCESITRRLNGRRKPGWFPVWIVRKEEWY